MDQGYIYVCDSTALIDLYQHFPRRFRRLRRLVSEGVVKIPEGVYRELRRKSDNLRRNIEKWASKYQFVISMRQNQQLQNEFIRIEKAYGEKIRVGEREYKGFWKSSKGRRSADGQVIAVGKVFGYIVVSDDQAIRLACMLENVRCIGWTEFARWIGMLGSQGQLGFQF